MSSEGLISGLITGGLGATIGSILTAVIQVVSKSGESRAKAADIITGASERIITRLERENQDMRKALVLLAEIDDEIVNALRALNVPPATIQKLQDATRAARLALH